MKSTLWAPWAGFAFGLLIACGLAFFFQENPLHVFNVLVTSSWASKYDLGLTLFYTTCLIFSGLSFSVPLKAGLFHIGAEGQILFSALTAAYLGMQISTDVSFLTAGASFLAVVVVTFLVGGLCAALIAAFKIYRHSHEVVVAIMLNFILAAAATALTVNHLQSTESQNPETALISPALQFLKNDFLKTFFDQAPISSFFLLAVLTSLAIWFFETRTIWGQQLRAFGNNPEAAVRLGLSKARLIFLAMLIAGFCSAGVGLTEVLGNSFQYKVGFSPQYGFLGIAVALLARQNALGIIFSAFLMACLHKGASDLDLETRFLTRDFSKILQALIIFSVAVSYFVAEKLVSRRKKPV